MLILRPVTLAAVFLAAGGCAEPPFRISAGGKPQATIVVAEQASETAVFAARELGRYLERITAAPFPVQPESGAAPRAFAIHVGRTRTAQASIDIARIPREGFVIRVAGRNLFLTGSDDDGAQFAVYEFLERYGGVHWFWPGAWGEEVPQRRDWTLPAIDLQQSPWFRRRTMSLVLRGARSTPKEYEGFGRKWKLGAGVRTVGVHAWGAIAPPAEYGPRHPEYFALVDGTRQRDWTKFDGAHEYQLCTSHPDVVRLSIEWARNYFDAHPEVDILSISPNDGLGFCECERCRRLDTGVTQVTGDNPFEVGAARKAEAVISDRMFTYANAVAEGVAATHPTKSVLMLAYSVYREPPQRVKPHPKLVVQYADNADFHADPARQAERVGALEQWARLTPNLMIYEYYVWGGNHPARGLTSVIAESIPRLRRLGIRLFRTQARGDFGLSGVNYYLASKLLWDPDLKPGDVLDDYFRAAFGSAARLMRSYFDLLDARWSSAVRQIGARYTPQNILYYLAAYDPSSRRRMRELLDRARERCSTEAQRGRVEFFAKAHTYSRLTVEAAESTIALGRAGMLQLETEYPSIFSSPTWIVDVKPPSGYSAAQRRLLEQAIAKWEERDRFLASLEGQGVVDTEAVRNYDRYYRFNSLARLREIRAALASARQ